MKTYQKFLEDILKYGEEKKDRTGVGTISLFGPQMEFNLQEGFPLLTTKKMATKAIISELLWFIEGSTDERRLAEILYGDKRENLIGKNTIWTANADNQGKSLGYVNTDLEKELGPVYGFNWRRWEKDGKVYDQLKELIEDIKWNPDSRRLILSAWNVPEINKMALPPCHVMFQFYVRGDYLDCKLYQRSADAFLGVPFNIASYALLTMMVADVCGLKAGRFIHTFGDAHIYKNHILQVKEQLSRTPFPLPKLKINHQENIEDYTMNNFTLEDYKSHDSIKAEMAI